MLRKARAAVVAAAVLSFVPAAAVHAAVDAHIYVSSGQTIDGLTPVDFRPRPDVNDAGQILYTGVLDPATAADAVFLDSTVLAAPGTDLGGYTFQYTYAGSPRLNNSGLVAISYRSTESQSLIATVPTGPGGGPVAAYPVTSVAGAQLYSIGPMMLSNAGTVAWNSADAAGPVVVTPDAFLVRHPSSIDGVAIGAFNTGGRYGMNSAGTVVFNALSSDYSAAYLFTADHKVLGTGSVVGGITLDWVGYEPAINDAGQVAFDGYYGGATQDIRGIFTDTRLVATNAGAIDGRTVAYFDSAVAINGLGQVAYVGNYDYNGNSMGLFLENQLLVETGSVIDGRTVATVGDPALNDAGLVVAYATFTDGSSGIITAQSVPEPGAAAGMLLAGGVGLVRRRRRSY